MLYWNMTSNRTKEDIVVAPHAAAKRVTLNINFNIPKSRQIECRFGNRTNIGDR